MRVSEFDKIVSKREKIQDLKINQPKLEVHDNYKIDERITTNFEPVNDSDVINKAYLDDKLSKIKGHLLSLEKDYKEFKLQNNKHSSEGIFIQSCENVYPNTL